MRISAILPAVAVLMSVVATVNGSGAVNKNRARHFVFTGTEDTYRKLAHELTGGPGLVAQRYEMEPGFDLVCDGPIVTTNQACMMTMYCDNNGNILRNMDHEHPVRENCLIVCRCEPEE